MLSALLLKQKGRGFKSRGRFPWHPFPARKLQIAVIERIATPCVSCSYQSRGQGQQKHHMRRGLCEIWKLACSGTENKERRGAPIKMQSWFLRHFFIFLWKGGVPTQETALKLRVHKYCCKVHYLLCNLCGKWVGAYTIVYTGMAGQPYSRQKIDSKHAKKQNEMRSFYDDLEAAHPLGVLYNNRQPILCTVHTHTDQFCNINKVMPLETLTKSSSAQTVWLQRNVCH